MPRRLVDISSPLQGGILSDPPHMLPRIDYQDHHATAPAMADYMGVRVDQFPDGEFAAVETAHVSTHNGTHMDAPYHYFSSMNHALTPGGEPSWMREVVTPPGILPESANNDGLSRVPVVDDLLSRCLPPPK
jgi:hypothetical protein